MSEQARAISSSKSPAARFIGVIVSPRETFEEIARQPGWLFPYLVYLVVFLIAFGVYAAKADWVIIITEQIENSPLMAFLPEAQRDEGLAAATQGIRKQSQTELVASNVMNVGSSLLPFFHVMALVYCTLFVMMGSLRDLKLGKAWLNLLLCLSTLLGYFVVYGISTLAFRDAPQSALLLTGTAAVMMTGGWIWLLNRHVSRDAELHRMLSVCAYASAVSTVSAIVLLAVSLSHSGAIQISVDKMVKSNLGALVKVDIPVLRALLESLDIFVLWFMAVLTIGFRAVTKLSTGVTASLAFLPWGIYVMLKIAFAAVSGK